MQNQKVPYKAKYQSAMLKSSLVLITQASMGHEATQQNLAEIAPRHGRTQLAITHELYGFLLVLPWQTLILTLALNKLGKSYVLWY
jgi:hypothetical protein